MMEKKRLESNIWKFALYFITHRRIFWPLLTVYFLTFPDNTVQEIGIFMGIGNLGAFIMEVPSGYIADKIGHKQALIISKICMIISTSLFLIGGGFFIFTLGSIFFLVGFSFSSGTITAFSHEVLSALGKDHLYSEIIGKIRSKTFIISAIILATLPFTVPISFKLPFLIALLFDIVGLFVVLSFVVPKNKHITVKELKVINFKTIIREGHSSGVYPIIILVSAIVAFVIGSGIYRDPYQQFLGISVVYLGVALGVSRLVAALVSNFAYKLHNKVSSSTYFIWLIFIYSAMLISIGYFSNKWFVVTAFIILVGSLWGLNSVHEHYKLEYIRQSNHKATLLSIGGLIQNLGVFFVSLLLSYLIAKDQYGLGFVYYGTIALFVWLFLYIIFWKFGRLKIK